MRAMIWIVVVLTVLLAGAVVADGLRLDDVVVELTGVATEAPFTAEHAVMTAITSADAVEAVLSVELDLSVRDGSLVASTTVLGLPLDVVLAPRAAGREVEVDVTGFVLAGASVQSADLPAGIADQLQGIRFAVEGLPAGMTLTQVDVTPGGLRLSAEGRDLALSRRLRWRGDEPVPPGDAHAG